MLAIFIVVRLRRLLHSPGNARTKKLPRTALFCRPGDPLSSENCLLVLADEADIAVAQLGHPGQGLHPDAHLPQAVVAGLEGLFHGDAAAHQCGPGLLHDVDDPVR